MTFHFEHSYNCTSSTPDNTQVLLFMIVLARLKTPLDYANKSESKRWFEKLTMFGKSFKTLIFSSN